MFITPFNKYTLQFIDPDVEIEYQSSISEERLLHFRILSSTLVFLTILFAIIFSLQNLLYVAIVVAFVGVCSLIGIYISKRIEKKLTYLYFILYLLIIGISMIVSSFNAALQPFIYGFTSSSMSISIAQYSHFKLRMIGYFIVPIIQLVVSGGYYTENFGYVILHFSAQLMIIVYSHQSEYKQRLAFSYLTQNKKQKELLFEFVTQPLFAISLNPRSQQFVLELENQKARDKLNINDDKSMIETLRHIQINLKEQKTSCEPYDLVKQSQGSKQQLSNKNYVTLEEQAFRLMFETLNQNEEIKLKGNLDIYQKKQSVQVCIKKVIFRKPTLFIVIEDVIQTNEQNKQEEENKFIKKLLTYIANDLGQSFYQLYNLIQKGEYEKYCKQYISQLKTKNLLLMNEISNFRVFIYSHNIQKEAEIISNWAFDQIIDSIKTVFQSVSLQFKKSFNVKIFYNENFNMKVNNALLNQILLNSFEIALKYSNSNSQINLNVSTQDIPQIKSNRPTNDFIVMKKIDESEFDEDYQLKVVEFQYQFFSENQISINPTDSLIINPKTFEEFYYNNNQQISLVHPIINQLLKYLGPYDKFFFSQKLNKIEFNQLATISQEEFMNLKKPENVYINTISFYVYQDCSKLPQSYFRRVSKIC